ncbi:MAG TPA: YfhO family protein, partial [Flavisolibacter sp.]|nr:YfhO family protein [Flavisolibacter sp.]
MNKGLFQKLLPHLIAIVVFLIVAVIYCKPALQGEVVNQHDVTQWKGSIQQSMEYKETHGEYPLWTNAMFSGMPAFQIGYPANNYIPWYVHAILTLGLPKPIQFFFLACICFYFLCQVIRINPYLSIFGALSFAYATYNPIIISVGHDTKMWSIAYMPALLGSIFLIFDRKYWIGAGLTALFTSVMLAMNHPQIDYYFFIAVGIMTIFFIVRWIRQKELAHLIKALSFTLVAGIIGLLVNAVTILSTYEYQKETIRGGHSDLVQAEKGDAETGLSKEYAFDYSMEIAEPLVMLIPRMYGGSSDKNEKEEDSKAVEAIQSLPPELQQQLPLSFYWGGIGGTSGPPYVGAIVCFLAILGMFVLDNKHKWWMLTTIILTIMMSWGSYFEGFNTFLYHSLPLYNKFRAPSMILVIPQLLLPILAVLTLQKIAFYDDKKELWQSIKKGLIATGAVVVLLLFLYMSFDFLSSRDKDILRQVASANQPQLSQYLDTFFDGLREDRKSLMLGDIFRSLGFMAVALGLIYLLIKRTIKPIMAFVAFTVLGLIDLMPIASNYLNADNYQEPIENEGTFQRTQVDETILADKSYYRVFNVAGNAFAEAVTSYHYNSIGGYHAVKLRIYQDLIEQQLSKQKLNLPVLNMLNTKYLIQKDANGLTQNYQRNDSALGAAWFVKNIRFVPSAKEEMQALDNFNPKDSAVIQEQYRSRVGSTPTTLSGDGTIQLVKNENDVITYRSSSNSNGFGVFSEIFYDAGWKAYIDGKETPISKVNYVLRGISIPAGNHEIRFSFEPPAY